MFEAPVTSRLAPNTSKPMPPTMRPAEMRLDTTGECLGAAVGTCATAAKPPGPSC